jgi:hypothetical protein
MTLAAGLLISMNSIRVAGGSNEDLSSATVGVLGLTMIAVKSRTEYLGSRMACGSASSNVGNALGSDGSALPEVSASSLLPWCYYCKNSSIRKHVCLKN